VVAASPERLDRPFSDPLFARLFPPLATGVPWGLERMVAALDELGDPHRLYATIHVAGTNGKGSVASTLSEVLRAAGFRTGLYTSPHLCSFRERIQVGGRALPEERLVEIAQEVRALVTRHGLTYFEAATVLGLQAFARERVDVAVIEVGLGGRLDATNVVTPEVCVVTNIAMDHAEYLGGTLELIAAEKAGIAKPGVPLVTAETAPSVVDVLRGVCDSVGAPFHQLDPARVRDVRVNGDGTTFTLDTRGWGAFQLSTPLVGAHQAVNTALAVEVLEHLPAELRPAARAVRAGVAGVSWPGRDQIERIDGRTWLFDVAHNPAGIRSLVDVLTRLELPRPLVAVVGVLADKEWREMLPLVLQSVDRGILTLPPSATGERRWDPALAEQAVRAQLPAGYPLAVEPDFALALDQGRRAAGEGTVVVTGSCYTVGDALRLLDRCPFPG
jgi:dihydrofolate synthase/folylpolyglutamate synthase